MTAISLALGLANRQTESSNSSTPGSSKSSDDADGSATASTLADASALNHQVMEVPKLSQLGENSVLPLQRPISGNVHALTVAELADMTDDEILQAMDSGRLLQHELEDCLEDTARAVLIRRKSITNSLTHDFDINAIPFENYDYDQVKGKCCENVIGYVDLFEAESIVAPSLHSARVPPFPHANLSMLCLLSYTILASNLAFDRAEQIRPDSRWSRWTCPYEWKTVQGANGNY